MYTKGEKIIVRAFVSFLKKKGVFYKYYANMISSHKYPISIDYVKSYIMSFRSTSDGRHAIDNSFCWADTPEGHDFWRDIHREWHEMAQKIYKQIKNTATPDN